MGGSMQARSVRRRRGIALFRRIQDAPPPPPPHMNELMKYGVPVALALLILRYQLKPDALFRENLAPLLSFAVATAVYWLTVGAMRMRRRRWCDDILRRGALAFGVVSLLSLLSMFLPHPISLLLLLVSELLLLALFFAYTWIHPPIISVINKIQAMLQQARSPHRTQLHQTNFQPHNLPV